jgi:hypothetical protein
VSYDVVSYAPEQRIEYLCRFLIILKQIAVICLGVNWLLHAQPRLYEGAAEVLCCIAAGTRRYTGMRVMTAHIHRLGENRCYHAALRESRASKPAAFASHLSRGFPRYDRR